jgi:hypothetical protein
MATPDQLSARLAAIETAIASGTTRVSYDGKSVEYRDIAELYRIRDWLLGQIGGTVPARRTVAAYSGGFW